MALIVTVPVVTPSALVTSAALMIMPSDGAVAVFGISGVAKLFSPGSRIGSRDVSSDLSDPGQPWTISGPWTLLARSSVVGNTLVSPPSMMLLVSSACTWTVCGVYQLAGVKCTAGSPLTGSTVP